MPAISIYTKKKKYVDEEEYLFDFKESVFNEYLRQTPEKSIVLLFSNQLKYCLVNNVQLFIM